MIQLVVGGVALREREPELERIDSLLAGVAAGGGSTLLIEGEPGIGKTALLEAACARARESGLRLLRARGDVFESELAFGIVRQLFGALVRGADARTRAELFADAARLAAHPLGLPAPGETGGPPGPGAELYGLYWMCANLADLGPTLLALDDLHWADEPSLRFLVYLVRRVDEHPLAICATSRPAHDGTPAPAVALAAAWAQVLRPRPLSEPAVEAVVREALAGAEHEFCVACARASGGNPFLLSEAIAALRADRIAPVAANVDQVSELRPQALSRVLMERLARVGPDATAIARAASVLGSDALLRRVARLAALTPERTAAGIDGLRREGVLAAGPSIVFSHPLIRISVVAEETARGLAQRRAAELLRDEGEATERIAHHLLAAEPGADAWVVETLRAVAAQALARGAPETAIALLERALDEPPAEPVRVDVLRELGRALIAAGRAQDGAAALERGLALVDAPLARAAVALEHGEALSVTGRYEQALSVLQDARARLPDTADRDLVARLNVAIAFALHVMSRPVAEWVDPLAQCGERGAAAAAALALRAMGLAASGARPADEAIAMARRAARLATAPAETYLPLPFAATTLGMLGRLGEASALLDGAIEAASRAGDAPRFSFFSCFRAWWRRVGGSAAEAEADARAAHRTYGPGAISVSYQLAALIAALVERGQLDEAQRVLDDHALDERERTRLPHAFYRWACGGLRSAQGRHRDALEDLLGCGAQLDAAGFAFQTIVPWRSDAALASLALGEIEQARRLAEEDRERARALGVAHALGIASRTLGRVEGDRDGIDLLAESVSLLEPSEARLELARSLVDLGAALRRTGSRRDAREPLRRGLDLATRCGAPRLADRAREELVAAGGRPRRAALTGPDSLTASELRIARLAAEGRTNREIAQSLFVTRRTVEVHLTSAYRKLEIDSRQALAAALADPAARPHPPAAVI